MNEQIKKAIDEVTKKFVDEGKIIEAGWAAMQTLSIPKEASKEQIHDMRMAYFFGAQHLFASIMNILEPGTEPTEKDLDRITAIDTELREFIKQSKESTWV